MYQLQKTLIEIIKSNHKVSPQETEEGAWMKVELCKWDDWEEIEEGNLMLLEKKSDNKNYNQAENKRITVLQWQWIAILSIKMVKWIKGEEKKGEKKWGKEGGGERREDKEWGEDLEKGVKKRTYIRKTDKNKQRNRYADKKKMDNQSRIRNSK